jgi:hypothetical protein
VKKEVYGGSSFTGGATDNTVTLSGTPDLSASTIHGGFSLDAGDVFTDNTLNLVWYSGNVVGIKNFEYINFYISDSISNTDTILTVTNQVDLTGVNINIAGIAAGSTLVVGESITLISDVTNNPNFPTLSKQVTMSDGSKWTLNVTTGALVATLDVLNVTPNTKGGGGGCNAGGLPPAFMIALSGLSILTATRRTRK